MSVLSRLAVARADLALLDDAKPENDRLWDMADEKLAKVDLVVRHNPKLLENIAVCSKRDSLLATIAECKEAYRKRLALIQDIEFFLDCVSIKEAECTL